MWGDAKAPTWRTLRATIRRHEDRKLGRGHPDRALRPRAPRVAPSGVRVVRASVSVSARVGAQRSGGYGPADEASHLWVRLPDAMRTDEPFGVERLVKVHVNDRQWVLMGSREALVADGPNPVGAHPLLFPANFADRLEVVDRDRLRWLDREAIRVQARPGNRFDLASAPGDLPQLPVDARVFSAADELVVVVDVDHGVVLRFEARFDGAPLAVIELSAVAFDEELSDELFTVTPPAGGFLPPPPDSIAAPLRELATQVQFVLYQPTWPAEAASWNDHHGHYQPADVPRGTPGVVTYAVPMEEEPAGILWIRQSDQRFGGEPDTRWGAHPLGLAWSDRQRPNERSKLRIHRDGTHLHLEASLRPLGWLQRVAAGLVPVEPHTDTSPGKR